jgi:hypothetical protein
LHFNLYRAAFKSYLWKNFPHGSKVLTEFVTKCRTDESTHGWRGTSDEVIISFVSVNITTQGKKKSRNIHTHTHSTSLHIYIYIYIYREKSGMCHCVGFWGEHFIEAIFQGLLTHHLSSEEYLQWNVFFLPHVFAMT